MENPNELESIMKGKCNSAATQDFQGDIFEAAKDGKLNGVIYHLANGTNLNLKDPSSGDWHEKNSTALHYAARNGHLSVVEYLVNHKADINAKNEFDEFIYLIILLFTQLLNMVNLMLLSI